MLLLHELCIKRHHGFQQLVTQLVEVGLFQPFIAHNLGDRLIHCLTGQVEVVIGPIPLLFRLIACPLRCLLLLPNQDRAYRQRYGCRNQDAAAAATTGRCRRVQRPSRLVQGSRYAATGSPASQRRTSCATSAAVAYRATGFFASARKHMASRAAGMPAQSARGRRGSSTHT